MKRENANNILSSPPRGKDNGPGKRKGFSVMVLFACLSLLGISLIPRLPVKLAPDQTLPRVDIHFSMRGSAPMVIEAEATSKLEAMFSRMNSIRQVTSTSGNGSGRVTLHLDKHANMEATRFEISTIIRQAWPQLPANAGYPSISVSHSDNDAGRPFLNYTIIAPAPPILIRQFVENHVKNHLSQIEGIYQVNVSGANPMEWQIEYDYHRLADLGLTVDNITEAISNHLRKESLGVATTTTDGKKQRIRLAIAPDASPGEGAGLADLDIKKINGKIIRLADIARVARVESHPSGYYRINGKNTVYLSLVADRTANQLELATTVKRQLDDLRLSLPPGYDIQLRYDATEYIRTELEKIYFRSGLTILLLFLFVLLAYRDARYTLLLTISLVVNLAVAAILYRACRLELQLYSLAGITISLTLVIDNLIVMADQIIRRRNKRAFLAILAATCTTIAALSIIFFLDEKTRLNLKDFAAVLIINLAVSLVVALFLVPALVERFHVTGARRLPSRRVKRLHARFHRFHAHFCRFLWRRRVITVALLVLSFGTPVFLLPEKIENGGYLGTWYNRTFGSSRYKEYVKPYLDVALGGTWRLFVRDVYTGAYITDRGEETALHVRATLPHGATLSQMNDLVAKVESYLDRHAEIRQFETSIPGPNNASIYIRFHTAYRKGNFPYFLQAELVDKVIDFGGGSWSVYGVGDGFNNNILEQAGEYRVELLGFNYDELLLQAERFKARLLEHRRITEVIIDSEFSWQKTDYLEFGLDMQEEQMALADMQPGHLFSVLNPVFERRRVVGRLAGENGMEEVALVPAGATRYNVWDLNQMPVTVKDKEYKLARLAGIVKQQAPRNIVKENQQYRICLQFNYLGTAWQAAHTLDASVKEFQQLLPVGYTIRQEGYSRWRGDENASYWLLALIFVIIYFCSATLLNSLRQPFCIIFIIPVSFIGIFLTFYWFGLKFDQGGFAAFVLLSGLTVNVNIYLLNEYNNIRRARAFAPLQAYLKAWSAKTRPILLTILSTILGFIPFMVGDKEPFWFSLAAGVTGGLIISLVATFCFLSLFMGVGRER